MKDKLEQLIHRSHQTPYTLSQIIYMSECLGMTELAQIATRNLEFK